MTRRAGAGSQDRRAVASGRDPRAAGLLTVALAAPIATGAIAAALVLWWLPKGGDDPFRTTLAILPLAVAAAFSIERWVRARGLPVLRSREAGGLAGAVVVLAIAAARAPSLGLAAADPLIAVGLLLVLAYWVTRLLLRLRPLLGARLPERPPAIFFWLPLLVYASLIPWTTRHRPPDGDEPYNLLIAHSLVFDHDADLANNYRDGDARRFLDRDIEPQLGDPHGAAGEIYSRHNLLLPLLLAAPYRVAGRGGALYAMAAITALLAWMTLRLARRYFPDRPGEVLAAWSVTSFLPPLLLYSSQIWVEVPAALLVVYGLDRVHAAAEPAAPAANHRAGRSRRAVFGLAAALLLLPLIKIRLTLLALSLLALFCWRAVLLPALRRPANADPDDEAARPPSGGAGGHGAVLSGVRSAPPSDRRRASARQERVGAGNGETVSRGDPSPHVERSDPPRLPGGRGTRHSASGEARARALTALGLTAILALVATAILLHNQARFGNPLKVHSVAELDLTTHPVERYLRGLGGLLFDGAFGLFSCAPIWLLVIPALAALLARRHRLLTDAAFVAVPYLVFVAPRGEWYGGWSPPFRYGLAFLPLLGIALTQVFIERRRPAARVVLGGLGAATAVLALLWVSAPGWTYNFANGTSRVVDHLETQLGVDVARLVPSYVRTRAAVWWGPFAAVLLALVWRLPALRLPRRGTAAGSAALGAALLLFGAASALIGAARWPTRTLEVEDPVAEKSGGELHPPMWTIDRWRYRGAWLLPEGERIVAPVATGGDRLTIEIETRYLRRRHPPLTLRLRAGDRLLGTHDFVEESDWGTVRLGPFAWIAGEPLVLEASGPEPPADDQQRNRLIIDRVRLEWP